MSACSGVGRGENHFDLEVVDNLYEMKPPGSQVKPKGRQKPRYQVFIKQILSIYYVLGTVLNINYKVNKRDMVSDLREFIFK